MFFNGKLEQNTQSLITEEMSKTFLKPSNLTVDAQEQFLRVSCQTTRDYIAGMQLNGQS